MSQKKNWDEYTIREAIEICKNYPYCSEYCPFCKTSLCNDKWTRNVPCFWEKK